MPLVNPLNSSRSMSGYINNYLSRWRRPNRDVGEHGLSLVPSQDLWVLVRQEKRKNNKVCTLLSISILNAANMTGTCLFLDRLMLLENGRLYPETPITSDRNEQDQMSLWGEKKQNSSAPPGFSFMINRLAPPKRLCHACALLIINKIFAGMISGPT